MTELKEDTVNSNAMYMVEIENVYANRNDCLKAYFKIYFTQNYLQLQIINRFKYGKMEFIIRIGISIAHLRLGTWFIIICNLYS